MRKKIREQQQKRDSLVNESEEILKSKDEDSTKNLEKEIKDVSEPKEVKPKEVKPKEVKPKEVKPKEVKPKEEKRNFSPKSKNVTKSDLEKKTGIEDLGHSKLEDLKRRSDALAAKTGVQLPKSNAPASSLFSKKEVPRTTKPVDKTPKKPVRSFRKTKKGGGKQPKQQKLNRRKQLEFRFDARAILDTSDIAEEHRSNIFGQIWAKGERIGIQSAMEYISQKEQEGILTSSVSEELVALIKSYTIKR